MFLYFTGQKSDDSRHPDYTPSLFNFTKSPEKRKQIIHQFDISGLSFAMGSGRELGVKELCQLYVYNSILRVKQSSVFEIRQKFLRFLQFYCLCLIWISRNSFFKSSCIRIALSRLPIQLHLHCAPLNTLFSTY